MEPVAPICVTSLDQTILNKCPRLLFRCTVQMAEFKLLNNYFDKCSHWNHVATFLCNKHGYLLCNVHGSWGRLASCSTLPKIRLYGQLQNFFQKCVQPDFSYTLQFSVHAPITMCSGSCHNMILIYFCLGEESKTMVCICFFSIRGVRLHWWRCRERWRGSSNKNFYSAIRLWSNCQRCKWCSYTVHTLHWWMDIQHLYDSIKIVRSLQWKSLSAQIWHTKTPEVKQWLHIYSTTMFISLMHWHTWEMLNSFGWNYAHHTTLHQQYERLKG